MIELIPAIDIIDGKCVRLTQGDYSQQKVYDEDPVGIAIRFEEMGCKRLHVVDLDGAKSGHIVNIEPLKNMARQTRLTIDFGGGLKTDEDIEKAFECGAAMVTVGSIAALQPDRFDRWLRQYGANRIILGADVKDGKVKVNGWKDSSGEDLFPFLKRHIGNGVRNILCTDISRDGTLNGPAIDLYKRIMELFPGTHLIASGGVSSDNDISMLEQAGIPAVVFGKAFYEGRINLKKLMGNEE
ncbi:MAG: 1-(5-phosphoribosyl)-5-[(5-phosphoribosylamino)methylideneamino]imidazole-4-carboxamide isomerase [Prevotella sp.]